MRVALLVMVAGCAEPALANLPRPNTAAAAGAAAAIAGAATLADPQGQARRVSAEEAKRQPEVKPVKGGGTVPADVLDRLDEKQRSGSGSGSPPGSESGSGAESGSGHQP